MKNEEGLKNARGARKECGATSNERRELNMQPEQAVGLAQFLMPAIEQEQPTTRKVIAAAPTDKGDYKPDPKARSAFELAWHIASSDVWFLNGIADGKFGGDGNESVPAGISTTADVVRWYDETFPKAAARVKAMSPADLARPIDFFGMFNYPAVVYLTFMSNHAIHHRGQLATYLRPMGGKVPSIYGGSADEPFTMAAGT
jgi:uncharacterized damage-inducible protein DinB